jgi:4-diphosphocytidyl-2-C-methyl-D-erythritol kinase
VSTADATSPVRLTAPAKLTRTLRVTGVRADGHHLIVAEMVSLDLADQLELHEPVPVDERAVEAVAGARSLRVLDAASGAPIDVGPVRDNLIGRALALVGYRADVIVTKAIPPGAGLGGGSSDAAAVLRWAGWTDLAAAVGLSADVAFCLVGGRARVTGIGEAVESLPFEALTFTLLTPPFGCSTPAVYRTWDEMGGPRSAGPNDLEPAALAVEPRLAEWRDRLGDATGQTPHLAGSGSTWFVEGSYPGDGRIVAHTQPAF